MKTTHQVQLVHVQASDPRVIVLGARNGEKDTDVRDAVPIVVQIHPAMLHFVAYRQIMCTIKSDVKITGIAELVGASDHIHHRLLVSTEEGNIYMVQLPLRRQSLKPIYLQSNALNPSSARIQDMISRRVCVLPGAENLRYIEELDALVCTSLLSPTTIVFGISSGGTHTLELDELEGDRATALVALRTVSNSYNRHTLAQDFLSRLIGDVSTAPAHLLFVFQGDSDGVVRFAVVDEQEKKVTNSGEVVHVNEPVRALVLIRSSENDSICGVCAVGEKGSLALASPSTNGDIVQRGKLPFSIKSMSFFDTTSPELLFLTREMVTMRLSVKNLRHQLQQSTNIGKPTAVICDRVHDIAENVVCAASKSNKIALITETGSVMLLAQGTELPRDGGSKSHPPSLPADQKLKHLLQEIGRVSSESQLLHEHSSHASRLLRGLNASLNLLRVVQSTPSSSVFQASFRMQLIDSGWDLQSPRVQVRFTLQMKAGIPVLEDDVVSMWRVLVAARASSQSVSTFAFSLSECLDRESSFLLDDSFLQDHCGIIQVLCDLKFQPDMSSSISDQASSTARPSELYSFSLPVEECKIHVIQLSRPTAIFSVNPVALREQYQASTSHITRSKPVHQAHEWWQSISEFVCDRGIQIQPHETDLASPLRFVLRVTSRDVAFSSDEDSVMALLSRLMHINSDEDRASWRSACRKSGGKWWVGIKTPSKNVVVLRLSGVINEDARSDGEEDGMAEITVQSSSVADLSAMRALLVHVFTHGNEAGSPSVKYAWNEERVAGASLALSHLRTDLIKLLGLTEDLRCKAEQASLSSHPTSSAASGSSVCQDELLRILERVAEAETRTLGMYWKSREVLNQGLPL